MADMGLANIILQTKRERRAQEEHGVAQRIRQIGLGRLEREEQSGVYDKELQVRGLKADYDRNEQEFLNTMQGFEQESKRLLSQGRRTGAEVAVGAVNAAQERQGDELTLLRENLNTQLGGAVERQLATFWEVLRLGDKKSAVDLYNRSRLIHPDEKASDIKLESVDATDQRGNKVQVPVLTVVPQKKGAKTRRIPVNMLEGLRERYGARYEKAGNNIVRINRDGSATPIYEQDQYMVVPEGGSVASRRTGQPPAAAAGINPPVADRPAGSDKFTGRVDERVRQLDSALRFYLLGTNEMASMDPKTQATYNRLLSIGGELIRSGANPEEAMKDAIARLAHEEAAAAASKRPRGGGAYSGPAPWRR
jgi:hypothetical protein